MWGGLCPLCLGKRGCLSPGELRVAQRYPELLPFGSAVLAGSLAQAAAASLSSLVLCPSSQ